MPPRPAASGKKAAKPGTEDKREDVLQAVVIADSFQTRFRPFSLEKPRCLLPLANTPLIEYTLQYLALNGVQEVFIYCGEHHKQIEDYIQTSRWSKNQGSCPFSVLEFVRVADARSVGDFLRDLDKRNIIDGDFILVHGDVVANIPLDGPLAAHRARREANRDSCMTLVLREAGEEEHHTKMNGLTPVFIVDPRANRCLHYEEINPLQSDHYLKLDPEILNTPEIEIRTDLLDAQIDICTPDVLALWSESFDYELPRANFLHGVLKDYELNGKMIHTEIVKEGYSARASDLQMYAAISSDVLAGWTYPFVPDSNIQKDQTYQLRGDNLYDEDDVVIAEESLVSNSVIGKDTHIGPGSTVTNSIIGRNCMVGNNVTISDSFIWGDAVINDGAIIRHAIIADAVVIGKGSEIKEGALLSFGVQISDKTVVEASTPISLLSTTYDRVAPDSNIVGPQGKGAVFSDLEEDEDDEYDPSRLQKSLIYSLEDFNISTSSISTLGSHDSDTDSEARSPREGRSRLSSFASDDSGGFTGFHQDAVHGLMDVLRGTDGNFDAEKLEFTSLRLASNASDTAMRRAIATAFVRRALELMNNGDTFGDDPEQGGGGSGGPFEPAKAARHVLTARAGATDFVRELGVGDVAVRAEQVEFALALERACAVTAKGSADPARIGNLLAAFLQQAYALEIVDEEGILAWWKDPRSQPAGPDAHHHYGEEMALVRARCQALVEWLEESDDDDDDDDDEDSSEEDDD
ncbi:translation initiation factor eIF-2B epsilon subunit, GEF [Diatrype stigma]|uniref:Mannose-1-phosphate guanyltransferase n=1 Tax=Diatrype stigma TaxID=117547 RepID=A0AAN9UL89_9PEZI